MVEPKHALDIDLSIFDKEIVVPGVKVPLSETNNFLKSLSSYLLHLPRKGVLSKQCVAEGFNVVLLNHELLSDIEIEIESVTEDKREDRELIEKNFSESDCFKLFVSKNFGSIQNLEKKLLNWPLKLKLLLAEKGVELVLHKITLGYEDLSLNEILKRLLPQDVVPPTSFEVVGSLAHLNLNPKQLPYKNIIGKALLDKNKTIKTVVNKVEGLKNVFRTPELEIIAGENNFVTELKEGKCIFELSYDKVYWNTCLQYERDRLLEQVKEEELILDLFCGIGPFSIRAAKKGCLVLANDLNPHCYEYLQKNVKRNKVESKVICYNGDAREIFRKYARGELSLPPKFKRPQHIYMNLPGDAISFCDIFTGFYKNCDASYFELERLPLVHVYSFVEHGDEETCKQRLFQKLLKAMGWFKFELISRLHHIKDVSSKKRMYCVTFQIPKEVALGEFEELKKAEEKEQSEGQQSESEEEKKEECECEDEEGEKIVKKLKSTE